PFMVVATQNPIEHEGTYPLPEAQLDRFMMRVIMGYPARVKELEMLEAHGMGSTYSDLQAVVSGEDVLRMIEIARRIYVSDPVREYLVDVVEATRDDPDLLLGASPRATLFLQRAARTNAAIEGRHYVTPDDVKSMLRPVLTHRLILRPEAQMRGSVLEDIVDGIALGVPVPGSGVKA
ncbi:MAG TPA: MoxR family ATPase, partial [Acidimicrobiia bacterium]|nr:MoxR family ATPase [Acidimicrobiia bacterium]